MQAGTHRLIVESSLDGLWLVDAHGRTLFANARVGELLGRTAAEVDAIGVADVLDERDRLCFEARLAALGHRETDVLDAVDTERVYRRPDGSGVPLMVSEQPLYDDAGGLVGYLHRLTDDSRRRALTEELRRSRSQLAEAQAIARLGSWEICTDPERVSWSQGMYDLLGVDAETFEAGPEAFFGQLVEADREPIRRIWERVFVEPGEHRIDVRVRRPDGAVRWVRAVGQVLEWAADGSALRIGGTVQDIHDLKEAELNLLDSVEVNTLMQFIATTANEATTFDEALASSRELLLAHPDWLRGVAFDVTPAGPRFRPVRADDEIVPAAVELAVAEQVLATGGLVFEETVRPQHPLIGFPIAIHGEPLVVLVITNRSPFVRHAMMTSLVSQVAGQLAQVALREEAAAELAAARDLAMAASLAKSEFLATMSHEIRTPLNGVLGLTDLLLHTDLDAKQRELAEAMQGAGRALQVLISDILDFSKIEAGGLELEEVEFQPAVVVGGTRELFAEAARARNVSLEVELDEDVPDRLSGDPGRLSQVLANLVSNAIKFTQDGRVVIRVGAAPEDDEVVLRVEVADTGIGMDPEQLARIFQPFRQADASTTRNFGGTGLGLTIAHRLAGALGGQIGVRSSTGRGSTFWFTARFRQPLEVPELAGRAELAGAERRGGGHVLVVEDNEVNQLVAVGMLNILGYTSEVAADGAAAAARAAGGRFDAVLMDLQMPRLDGYAATRLIRGSEPSGVRVPIIALTASATAGEQERCLAAGMTGFLSKPVGLEALGKVLHDQLLFTSRATATAQASAQPEEPPARTQVLDPSRLEELIAMGAEAVPLVRRAVDNFIASCPEQVADLRTCWADEDAGSMRAAAHKLKGSAANLGAGRLAELARVVEELAEAGDLEEAGAMLDQLEIGAKEAVLALSSFEIVAGPRSA
ncbi:MAG: response regulator [Nocardioidaceae bacterium]|nr:response regulator [Nocardioidaceae bacterium]